MVADRANETTSPLPVLALLGLSLLRSLGVLRRGLFPDVYFPGPRHGPSQFWAFALLAVAAAAWALMRKDRFPRGMQLATAALIGIGLFAVPSLLLEASGTALSSLTLAALTSLVPVFTVVLEPSFRDLSFQEQAAQPGQGLLAALTIVAGTLLVFPLEIPQSAESALAFLLEILAAACIAASNCWAVRVATRASTGEPRFGMASFAAVAGAAAATVFAAASLATRNPLFSAEPVALEYAWTTAVELPGLLLLFWLLPRMSAVKMSTRYPLALLLPVVIGAMLLRTPLRARTCLGLLLMASGAVYLLRTSRVSGSPPASFLSLK